jgi:hypothetical protein
VSLQRQLLPKVILTSIAKLVGFQVVRESTLEGILSQEVVHHTNH